MALDKHWHLGCFKCKVCNKVLNAEYISKLVPLLQLCVRECVDGCLCVLATVIMWYSDLKACWTLWNDSVLLMCSNMKEQCGNSQGQRPNRVLSPSLSSSELHLLECVLMFCRDGIPYCEADYHAMFGIQCETCKTYITGKVLEVWRNLYYLAVVP